MNLFIPVVLGTAREGRRSEHVANFVLSQISGREGIETELIDVREYAQVATNNSGSTELQKKYCTTMTRADGLIVVSPEYNHGYPGELKMMLDMAYEHYAKKPIGICGVSMGGLGGVRMVEQLRLVSIELHMVPIREAVYFSSVQNLFDERGGIQDDSYEKRVATMLDELIWYAGTLKQGRRSV